MALKKAAFFRVEGTLISRSAVQAAGWMAARSQRMSQRIPRLSMVALSAPLSMGMGDVALTSRLCWMGLRGTTEDRLEILGEDYWEEKLADAQLTVGVELLKRCRRDGYQIVLLSDHLEPMVRALVQEVGADHLIANHLELRNGSATGRLCDPVVARFGGAWLRRFAEEHDIDLAQSRAYGHGSADQILLSSIGFPCAVHPDRRLRRVAKDLDWPIVERA